MDTKELVILRSEIEYQMEIIETIFDNIDDRKKYIDEVRGLESLAYQIHNLYSAFEDLFLIVAKYFENTIEDKSRYHIELLRRMVIDIKGVRPPLLAKNTAAWLDELRAFRHVFRHAYSYKIDKTKLMFVLDLAEKTKNCYKDDITSFFEKLSRPDSSIEMEQEQQCEQ